MPGQSVRRPGKSMDRAEEVSPGGVLSLKGEPVFWVVIHQAVLNGALHRSSRDA